MNNVKFNNKSKPFKEELDRKVSDYFSGRHISQKGNSQLYIKTAVLLPLAIGIYLVLVLLQPPVILSLFLCFFLGAVMACIGFNIMHDAAHGSYSNNKKMNDIMSLTLNMMGGSDFMWKIKHNIIHHTYTNIAGEDEDIAKHPLFRFSPEQKRFWFHRYQHIYAPFLYMFSSLSWTLFNDYQKYFQKRIESTPIRRMKLMENIIFWSTKVLYLAIFLLIPILVFGFLPAVTGFLVMHATLGLFLSFVFQMAHCVEDTRFPVPDPQSHKIENEWAIHQVVTTANFAMKSRTITWLLGGLNFQIEHHLFPRISHVHYKSISLLVQQTCKEFDIPYIAYPSFGKAVHSHFRHLWKMGR